MLVASTFGFNYNLPPPGLGERRNRRFARRLVAVRRRAILVLRHTIRLAAVDPRGPTAPKRRQEVIVASGRINPFYSLWPRST
jgi:hypothetical protein